MRIVCVGCGSIFSGVKRSKFCNSSCRIHYFTKNPRKCKYCSNEFIPENNQLFCTKTCRSKWDHRNNPKTKNHLIERRHSGRDAWRQINARCSNSNSHGYSCYGGKGIEVKFKNFEEFQTLYLAPTHCPTCKCEMTNDKLCKTRRTISRINSNDHYSITNCIVECMSCNVKRTKGVPRTRRNPSGIGAKKVLSGIGAISS